MPRVRRPHAACHKLLVFAGPELAIAPKAQANQRVAPKRKVGAEEGAWIVGPEVECGAAVVEHRQDVQEIVGQPRRACSQPMLYHWAAYAIQLPRLERANDVRQPVPIHEEVVVSESNRAGLPRVNARLRAWVRPSVRSHKYRMGTLVQVEAIPSRFDLV